jgi:hypothetical protein
MTKPTPSQEKILKAAAKNPDCDIRDFMTHITIRSVSEKVFQALLQNGWIEEDEASAFRITAAGCEAVGMEPKKAEGKAEKPKADKPPRVSKKGIMLELLTSGTTLKALMEATGWQKHSVHGAMANLKKQQNLNITQSKAEGADRVYKIA